MMRSSSAGNTAAIGMFRYCCGSDCWAISSSDRWSGWPFTMATTGSLSGAAAGGGVAWVCAGAGVVAGLGGVAGGVAGAVAGAAGLVVCAGVAGCWAAAGPNTGPTNAAAAHHRTARRRRRKRGLMRGSENEEEGDDRDRGPSVYTGPVVASKH